MDTTTTFIPQLAVHKRSFQQHPKGGLVNSGYMEIIMTNSPDLVSYGKNTVLMP
jgi:hypothetical protein